MKAEVRSRDHRLTIIEKTHHSICISMSAIQTVTVKASVDTVWNLLANLPRWREWNPDIFRVQDVRHTRNNTFDNGTTCEFLLEDSVCCGDDEGTDGSCTALHVAFYNLVPQKRFAFSARGVAGLLQFEGSLQIKSITATQTRITYHLSMAGFMGPILSLCFGEKIRLSVDEGLERLAVLSEEAERGKKAIADLTFSAIS